MNILEPERGTYLKDVTKKTECIFCSPNEINGQICNSLGGEHWFVIANRYPYMNGNLVIISRRHIEDTSDLSNEEWNDWIYTIEATKKRLSEIFQTTSFNIAINLGEFSARSIAHIHWQIIPRTRIDNPNAFNIFSDLHVISVSPEKLVTLIETPKLKV